MSDPYALDRDGKRIYAGDYVECIYSYPSMPNGQRRRVIEIRPYECISLGNGQSPVGVSDYKAYRFKLAGRHHPAHRNNDIFGQLAAVYDAQDKRKQEITPMLHIAILMVPNTDFVDYINKASPSDVIAGRTKQEIQERVRDRITLYPHEKWLICSGNTIAETQSPVVFRSL